MPLLFRVKGFDPVPHREGSDTVLGTANWKLIVVSAKVYFLPVDVVSWQLGESKGVK